MNTINSIVDQVKQSTDFQINKRLLYEKIQTELHMPYNNGLFKLSLELMAFVATWPDEELFLEDVYNNPIKIIKLDFLTEARKKYYFIMNQWHIQYNEIKQIRKI